MSLKLHTLFTILLLTLNCPIPISSVAPSPAVDCSSVVLNLADCLSYVTVGSTVKKPEGSCCSGLKTVLKTNADCLCAAFKNSAQLGVKLNITRALALPSLCKLSAPPSIANCGISPSAAPALAPTVMPPTSGAPTAPTGADDLAPAPGPTSAASSALAISVALLFLGLVFAFSSF